MVWEVNFKGLSLSFSNKISHMIGHHVNSCMTGTTRVKYIYIYMFLIFLKLSPSVYMFMQVLGYRGCDYMNHENQCLDFTIL